MTAKMRKLGEHWSNFMMVDTFLSLKNHTVKNSLPIDLLHLNKYSRGDILMIFNCLVSG